MFQGCGSGNCLCSVLGFKIHFEFPGEEVPDDLLKDLPDPVSLGNIDTCNDISKRHKREPPKDSDDAGFARSGNVWEIADAQTAICIMIMFLKAQ